MRSPGSERPASRNADRRTARTQAALRGALVRLLRRKHYGDITVQDIIDEADVGRSTFYAHCSGKDQLLRLSLHLLRAEIAAARQAARTSGECPSLSFGLPVFMHLAGHRDLYPALARGRGHDIFMIEFRQLILELAKTDLEQLPRNDTVPPEAMLQFVVGTFTALMSWWLEHNKGRTPPELMNEMFQRLALHGIRQDGSAQVDGRVCRDRLGHEP